MGFYDEFKRTIDWFIFVLAFGIFIWLFPLLALFGFKGAESAFNRELVTFYWSFGSIVVFLISMGELAQFIARKNEKAFRVIGWLGSIIHNPEMSILYNRKTKHFIWGFGWAEKISVKLWVFFLIFSVMGVLAVVNNTFLIELPHIAQQILPLGEAILEVEPAGTEIFGLVFLVGLIMFIFRYIQKRSGFDDSVYWVITIPVSIVFGVFAYGIPLHYFRYSSSDQSLVAVAIFWLVSTILILLFTDIFLVWLFKDMNNLFKFLNGKYSDDKTIVATIIVFVVVLLAGILVMLIKNEKKKKSLIGIGELFHG